MADDNPIPDPAPPGETPALHGGYTPPATAAAASTAFADIPPTPTIPPEAIARSRRALVVWLVILVVFGAGGLAFGQQEMSLLVAIAGVVIAAHAADFHRQFKLLYQIVSVALIGFSGVMLLGIAAALTQSGAHGAGRVVIPVISAASAVVMFSTGIPAVGMALAHTLFGAKGDSHSYRLAGRLTLLGFLIAIPGWYLAQTLFEREQDMTAMFQSLSLGGAVLGYIIVALAAVGFLMRRDVHSTLERLGLTKPRASDLLLVAVGVPALFAINWLGEGAQQHWFHSLWLADRKINESIAGALDKRSMIALALTAGIGEEITMRGALQPKLGLVRTSLFFAALHVQYSWYGMALIFTLGLVLGIIRKRSNTAVAMTVHAIYDLLALMGT